LKISVIMSVFNGEKHIEDAIESILDQTYRNFEFIIIDDGSFDKSLEIIQKYAAFDNRIKIIKNAKNIGLTKSLNKSIKMSKGDFIARQDVDDFSLPNRLKIQYDYLLENHEYSFNGCNGTIKQTGKALLKFFELHEIKNNLIIQNCFTHSTIFIRKQILKKYGYYDENYLYGQDYELWCRLIYKHNLKAKNLTEKLIIQSVPLEKLKEKNKEKFLGQKKNFVKTKLKYIRYSKNIVRGFVSIIKDIAEIAYVILFGKERSIKII